jgi:acyl-CoA reductase-like NAD-dependent aldehyde dehydrogenase
VANPKRADCPKVDIDAKDGILIGGAWIRNAEQLSVRLPYDDSEVTALSRAHAHHAEQAVAAARRAFREYGQWPAHRRAELLRTIARLLTERSTELATAIALETGKPIREATVEAQRSPRIFEYAAAEAVRIHGETIPLDGLPGGENRLAFTIREPIGVIAAITPFNFPLALASHKVAPALAAGNSVVLKPAELTPLSSVLLARAISDAGAPDGLFNLLVGPGSKIGDALVRHPEVAMVTFTGSVDVGVRIRREAGLKRVTLELGANCAAVVEPDADLDLALARCVIASFAHSGQVCISLQRLFIQQDIYDGFVSSLVDRAASLKIGHPLHEETQISSLITQKEAERVERWIHRAVEGGAKVLTGGTRRKSTILPTVLAGVKPDMDVCCSELFGPVVTVSPYKELDDAIGQVNDSRYGLQAGIFTQNISRGLNAAARIQTGGVMINEAPMFRIDHMPYGGVKESGVGREGPRYAVEEMTEAKLVTVNLAAGSRKA